MSVKTYLPDSSNQTSEADIKGLQIIYVTNDNETFILDADALARQLNQTVKKGETENKEALLRILLEVYTYNLTFHRVTGDARVNTKNLTTLTALTTNEAPSNTSSDETEEKDE